MKRALPIMLAVAALFAGATAPVAFAQDAPAAGGAQAGDPEAAANEAYKAWKAETDEAKKFELAKTLVSGNPGTKAAEAVAYAYMFDQKQDATTAQRKYEVSKAYWDAVAAGGKEGAYLEYALGNLVLLDKDPAKVMEYGRTYLQKYPSGKVKDYVNQAISGARYKQFDQMIKDKRWNDAIRVGEEAFAANDNEFIYAYLLTTNGLADETATGAKSPFVGKVSAWAERGITFVEGGKVPPSVTDKAKWEADKPKTIATLYKARAIDTDLRIVGSNPTTPEAYQPAIDEIKRALTKNEKDAALYYFLGQAYSGQYAIYSQRLSAMPADQQSTDAGKAALEQVNSSADMVIDSWVKYVAYAQNAPPAITQQLEELWKFRHPDAPPTGWQDEVKKVNGGVATAAPAKPGK